MISRLQQSLGVRSGHGLTRVALDLEAIRAPARVAGLDRDGAGVRPARLSAPRRLWQQQGIAGHHAVHALGVHARRTHARAFAIDQRAGSPVAVAWQLSNLLADVRQQLLVATRRALGSAINP